MDLQDNILKHQLRILNYENYHLTINILICKYHNYFVSARQPVVQQVKQAFEVFNEDWKKGDEELKGKMDQMIELQRLRLQLERDRLDFEREKAGLKKVSSKYNLS